MAEDKGFFDGEVLPSDVVSVEAMHPQEYGANFARELRDRMFVAVADSTSPDQFLELADALVEMRRLPRPSEAYIQRLYDPATDEVRIEPELDDLDYWHLYRTRVERPGKPGGFTARRFENDVLGTDFPKREAIDNKDYIHYHSDMLAELTAIHEQQGWGPMPPEVLRFFELAEPIHAEGKRIFTECLYALECDTAYRGIAKIVLRPDGSVVDGPLRGLAYLSGQGFERGQLHSDKGFGTLARWESQEGCRVDVGSDAYFDPTAGSDGKWIYPNVTVDASGWHEGGNMKMIRRPNGTAAFFLGSTASRVATAAGMADADALFVPTQHDIIEPGTPTPPFAEDVERVTFINFFNAPDQGFGSKAENHGVGPGAQAA